MDSRIGRHWISPIRMDRSGRVVRETDKFHTFARFSQRKVHGLALANRTESTVCIMHEQNGAFDQIDICHENSPGRDATENGLSSTPKSPNLRAEPIGRISVTSATDKTRSPSGRSNASDVVAAPSGAPAYPCHRDCFAPDNFVRANLSA